MTQNPIEFLTVDDVKNCLGIGNDKAYALFKQKSFPSIRINRKHLIEKNKFMNWLDTVSKLPNKTYIIE